MGESSTAGQPTKLTQPFILSCNQVSAVVVPSGECLQDEGLVWFIAAVVCLLAAVAGPVVP